jgi:hypothetical protein
MSMLNSAAEALGRFIVAGIEHQLEPVRLARAGYALLAVGCSPRTPMLMMDLTSFLLRAQRRDDGGWGDVEETAWCHGYLAASSGQAERQLHGAKCWLQSQQLSNGGWGRNDRDRVRIPIVGLLSALVPQVVDIRAANQVAQEWHRELTRGVSLTYKGAFFLLTQCQFELEKCEELVSSTLQFLSDEQNDDGGFGPWKNHPVGSDPWTTGIVLLGLSRFGAQVDRYTLQSAISWLEQTQLPDGNWPYHYLDDGTSMAVIGISSILPFLSDCR